MLQWEPILLVYFLNQEEDSEEEPKLKYERLSNGVTEILQKDAASCMTVHDKVEVIIHHPQGHFSLESTHLKYRVHIVYVHIREMAAHSFLTFLCFPSQGATLEDTRRHCLPSFYSHPYIFFTPLLRWSNVDIFKSATLGEMVNRCGTSSTHARLSRAKVIPSYVSSPDVLLTAIDFHLFIFTLRIWSLFFKPQNSNGATVRDVALLKF